MNKLEALQEMSAKVEVGVWFPGLAQRSFGGVKNYYNALEAYKGSLDAAKALHDAVLPGWEYGYNGAIAWVKMPGLRTNYRHDGQNGYTSRAWLLAIICALITQEENK